MGKRPEAEGSKLKAQRKVWYEHIILNEKMILTNTIILTKI
jgi:hypothetical protein